VFLRGVNYPSTVRQLAQTMGLFATFTDGVENDYASPILIIGTNEAEFLRKVKRVETLVQLEVESNERARQDKIDEMNQKLIDSGNDTDIAGSWAFTMPEFTDSHSYKGEEIFWNIVPSDNSGYRWALFHLIIVQGIARIRVQSTWRGKQLKFAWRGTEAGEGVIEYDDHINVGTITFPSANTCYGEFCTGYGNFEFTGKKVGTETTADSLDCQNEFDGYTWEAYEYARIHRW
jgi:hypothetical protein